MPLSGMVVIAGWGNASSVLFMLLLLNRLETKNWPCSECVCCVFWVTWDSLGDDRTVCVTLEIHERTSFCPQGSRSVMVTLEQR